MRGRVTTTTQAKVSNAKMATFRVGVGGDRWRQFVVMCCVVLFSCCNVCAKDRATYRMIYQDISFASPCIRRTNATHQIGCTSNLNGNTGVIHLIETPDDIKWLQDKGPHAPYMAVFNADMFTRKNIEDTLKTDKVNGIVVDHSNYTRKEIIEDEHWYSSDKQCPNQNFGLYNDSECPIQWNPDGDGTNFDMDFGVPMFALTHDKEVEFIRNCYFAHNHPNGTSQPEYPLCSMELDDFMFAVKDTPTCMWRTERVSNLETSQYCDPIGDKNVWGFAKNKKPNLASSPSIIIAAAQIDATALFYGLTPRVGAESVVSGFVPLLAAAEAIGKLKEEQKNAFDLDIMFTFFNGETYDYIGSSRMVYDMMRGYFPNNPEDEKDDKDKKKTKLPQINVTDIAYFLELKQLGLGGSTYYAHVDPISQQDEDVHNMTEEVIKILQGAGDATVVKAPSDQTLPPASFQRFLKSGAKIPGVVLTDHGREFKNKFYNSRYDIPLFLGIDSVTWDNDTVILPISEELNKISNTVAKGLVTLAGGDESDVTTDVKTVNQLLFCFLANANCTLFRSIQDEVNPKISPVGVDLYAGVHHQSTQGSGAIISLLSYYLGEKTEIKKEDKDKNCSEPEDNSVFKYRYAIGTKMSADEGICIKSTVHNTPAVSPAFINDEHTKPDWASTEYSTWTESQWALSPFQIKVFLIPSPQQEWVTFSVGIIVLLISFSSVYFINAKADVLFKIEGSL